MTLRRSVVIIGGGIAGLAAAWELTGGSAGPTEETPRVEILEASDRLGGPLRATEFAGRRIDLGPDGFLARRPEAVTLAREIGLGEDLVGIAASGASILLRGALEELPAGLVLGVPTDAAALKGMRGLSRAARWSAWRDQHAPRSLRVEGDIAIGDILRRKLGSELTYQLIEPMVGGIQAGRVDQLSAKAVFPALYDAAQRGGSLMKALRRASPTSSGATADRVLGPLFMSLRQGVGSLADTLAARLEERGVVVRLSTPASAVRLSPAGTYPLEVDTADTTTGADAIIVAVPAPVAADLCSRVTPTIAALRRVDSAAAAMVTVALDAAATSLPATGTGVLVPLGTPWDDDLLMTTALTFLDRKWEHLRREGEILVRAHVGRIDDRRSETLDDDALISRVHQELGAILGRVGPVLAAKVQRWPQGLPQYYVGHEDVVASARAAVAPYAIRLAGSPYDGVGIPASIGSGRRAASEVLEIVGTPQR